MFVRLALSVGAASVVTFALLFVMQLMITTDRRVSTDFVRHEIVDFVRVERPELGAKDDTKLERPPAPEVPPALPAPDFDGNHDYGLSVAVMEPAIRTDLSIASSSLAAGDGEYLPIVKVSPTYPQRALARRLEGYVLVEFVVTETGSVRDVVVLESTAEIFEAAAIDAALKFKFKPRVVAGEPVEVRGVKNRIVFELAA